MSGANTEMSQFAPRIIVMKINPDKIRDVIGKGGAVIQALTKETGTSIDIEEDGTIKNIKAFLLADMIGDADLNVDRDASSTPWLEDTVLQAATQLGYQSHFFGRTIAVEDDHLPFVHLGVPSADLIDLDYGYGNVFHHTPQDTLDKLSPKSIEIVGKVILQTIQLLDKK